MSGNLAVAGDGEEGRRVVIFGEESFQIALQGLSGEEGKAFLLFISMEMMRAPPVFLFMSTL